MRIAAVAVAFLVASPLARARVVQPLGRQPKVPHELKAPKLWEDKAGAFALSRPEGERWLFRGGIRGPDGETVPLVAVSHETGAQLVIQSADGVQNLRMLASFLAENLSGESRVHVEQPEKFLARGGEAYAFAFTVADEVRGRVAVVRTGEHVALVIASWPLGAPADVLDDVEHMIGSLGPVPGTLAPGTF